MITSDKVRDTDTTPFLRIRPETGAASNDAYGLTRTASESKLWFLADLNG
jgi:hypothetical protein